MMRLAAILILLLAAAATDVRAQVSADAPRPLPVSVGMAMEMIDRGLPVVVTIRPGSPAERAGLAVGDTIVMLDGRDPREGVMFGNAVPGQRIPLVVHRAGAVIHLVIVPDPPRSAPPASH